MPDVKDRWLRFSLSRKRKDLAIVIAFEAKSLKIRSVLGGCHFFLETRRGGVIPPKYETGHQQKSTFFDEGGRGDCRRSVRIFGFFLQSSPR